MNLSSVIALAKSIIMNVVRDLEWPSVYDSLFFVKSELPTSPSSSFKVTKLWT